MKIKINSSFESLIQAEKQRAIAHMSQEDFERMHRKHTFKDLQEDLEEVRSIIVDLKKHRRPRRARMHQQFVAVATPSGRYLQGEAERQRLQEAQLACRIKLESLGISSGGKVQLDSSLVHIFKAMGSLIVIEGNVLGDVHKYRTSDLDNLIGTYVTIRIKS